MKIITSLILILSVPKALAWDYLLSSGLFFEHETLKHEYSWSEVEASRDYEFANGKLGIRLESGMTAGFAYFHHQILGLHKTQGYGAFLGLDVEGLVVAFDLFLQTYLLEPLVTYRDGSGYLIDVGYLPEVAGVRLGPQVSYQNFRYKTKENELGIKDNNFVSLQQTNILPQICLQLIF